MQPSNSIPARWRVLLRAAAFTVSASGLALGNLVGPGLPTAFASNYGVMPTDMTLNATFNSIGVEVNFTGDDNANSTMALQFKKSTDATWRAGLPLWRTDDGSAVPGRAFYGSAMLLDPGTSYDVKVTVSDADGVSGAPVLSGSTVTRTDNIPAASSLAPTYFVRSTGSDNSSGTSAATAWLTLDKALRYAPSGAVVQIGPGYFKASPKLRALPVTLVAQYPAVDDNENFINAGQHTVIDNGADSGPAASTAPGVVRAPWQAVSFVDPADASKTYTVWKWAASLMVNATQFGYSTARDAEPKRLAQWAKDSLDLATPAGWAKKLYTNQTYNYGFYADGADVYARLPSNVDPNTMYVTLGGVIGLQLDGLNMRVSGVELRQHLRGIFFGPHAHFGVADHLQIAGSLAGVSFGGQAGTPAIYGSDHVVQYNRIDDSSLWTANHTTDPGIPWTFIKAQIINADGSTYPTTRIGGFSESVGVWSKDGGAQRVVVRHNTIDGSFNGMSTYNGGWTDRYANEDMDIHDNLIHHISDDSLEPSGQTINFRAWDNRVEDASDMLSTDPLLYGPIYLFRNEGWRMGTAGVPYDARGNSTYPASALFKYDLGSTVRGRVFVINNTLWADPSLSTASANGGADYGALSGSQAESFYLRNNIIHVTRYAFSVVDNTMWNEDYNNFSTTDQTRGLQYGATSYTTNVASYRWNSGQGGHSNISNTFVTTPVLNGPTTGDLTLPAGSPLIDAGVVVPNIADQPGVEYTGAAPDLGATER